MEKSPRLLALSALLLSLCLPASATENGQTTYPVGVSTEMDGVMPPVGATEFYNYTELYVANKFVGNNGQSIIPGFHIAAEVTAPRIVHTWAGWGPFSWSSGIVGSLFHIHLNAEGASGNRTAIGDTLLQPLILSYKNPSHTFFIFFSPEFSAPTGSYQANRMVNTGVNYWTVQPSVGITWYPSPRWELSANLQTEFHAPNKETHYHSGDLSSIDWLVGYDVTKKVQLGVQGYYLKQFTDDTINGQSVPGGGFRGQAASIGPQFRYEWGPGAGFILKYEHEFAVRNRPQGDRLWAEVAFPL
ncbi:putative MetA-pathway of phenol degradation [Burkholderia multivorans]